jgi:hypothetical protein
MQKTSVYFEKSVRKDVLQVFFNKISLIINLACKPAWKGAEKEDDEQISI